MRRKENIDHVLKNWEYQPGEVDARLTRGDDGREVVQLRIDMGLLQMEVDGRPDGARPQGAETYYDYLVAAAIQEGDEFRLSEEQCGEADREFVQFYQRRLCWLALREYQRAVKDADHSIAFMDFCTKHSPSEEWTWSHEQYRPFILFHRTQAAAMAALDDNGPEAAIAQLNDGLERIRAFFEEHEADEKFEDDELVARLRNLRESVRDHYHVGRTLEERLKEAIDGEQYELAAKLRDQISQRKKPEI
ncbi:MAG: UvrB/UvrC motif-containing protein [Planctomycetaceae bacterium]|nr:UvrB/UvrC motif-containing protein [Planctomycetaceae bacterium]